MSNNTLNKDYEKEFTRVNFQCPIGELAEFDAKIEGSGQSRSECLRNLMKGLETVIYIPTEVDEIANTLQGCIDTLEYIATVLYADNSYSLFKKAKDVCKALELTQGLLVSERGI